MQDKVWVEDPDGNSWEVFVVLADAQVMGSGLPAATTKGKEAACCGPQTGCTPSACTPKK